MKKQTECTPSKWASLKTENLRLHRKICKLEAQLVSLSNHKIAQLENVPLKKLTDEELTLIVRQSQKKSDKTKKF